MLAYAGELLTHPGESLEAVEEIITEHLEELEKVAADSVREEGYDYPVQAKLVNMSFDDRTYGNLTMPAGEYDALRITIGKAEGQNWWCVVFPPLCTAAACQWQDAGRAAGLEEDDLSLMAEEDAGYELRFRSVELWEMLRQWLGK